MIFIFTLNLLLHDRRQARDHCSGLRFSICKRETTGSFQRHVGVFSSRVSGNKPINLTLKQSIFWAQCRDKIQ